MLSLKRQFTESRRAYEEAMRQRPGFAEAEFNLSLSLLIQGNFEEGWAMFESRFRVASQAPQRHVQGHRWLGEDLAGRKILIQYEQAHGDTIQFIRYVAMVKERGAHVTVLCPPALRTLFTRQLGIDQVICDGDPLGEFDFHCPLLSLPWIFQTRLETIPAQVPYLRPDTKRVESWRDRLGDRPKPKVGLVWAGNRYPIGNRIRSMEFETLAPIVSVPGINFFSLQKGEASQQLRDWSEQHGPRVEDFTNELTDFADTAALIENLDLVISVDTAVAHLAGALGKAVWVMLPMAADWRWLLDRTDSPWYPTMRLFRQARFGDWAGTVETIQRELVQGRDNVEV